MIQTIIIENSAIMLPGKEKAFRSGVFSAIGRIVSRLNCRVLLFSATGVNKEQAGFLAAALKAEGCGDVAVCRAWGDLKKYDSAQTVFVAGSEQCEEAANRGVRTFCLGLCSAEGVKQVNDWNELYRQLVLPARKARVERNTAETKIKAVLNLDGSGAAKISTGLGFFDHMLELFTRHSGIDLELKVDGDLHVDEHHTIEDTAIVLGQAFAKCLTDKAGLERYGFVLPMDESYATVAIDFSGRSDLIWQAEFKREMVGDMPTEMFRHFFKAFCDNGRCNILIKVEGDNEHHKIEAAFKGLARAIRMAIRRDPDDPRIPSTKELL